MTRIPDRDQAVEQLLRTIRSGDAAGPSEIATTPCPDASELAAWADADLEPGAAAIMDAHIATCGRCQAVVATLVRTAPAPAVVLPFWRRPSVALPIVSIGAAAAAVLAIAVWSRPGRTSVPVATVAEATPPPAAPPVQQPVATPPALQLDAKTRARAPARQSAAATGAPAAPRQSAKARADVATSAQEAAAKPAAPPNDLTPDRAAREAQASAKVTGAALAAPPPPAILTQPPAGAAARDPWQVINMAPGIVLGGVNVGGSASGQQLTVNAFGTSSNVQWNLEGGNITDLGAVAAEFSFAPAPVAPGGSGGGGRGGGRAGAGATARAAARSTASDATVLAARWRIFADGHVERSTDAGATWMKMSTEPSVFITAGVASDAKVCWLAGRAGVVLVTTDAEHFARVDLPDRLDAKSMTALGRNLVSIVTTTGATYSSADGGRIWRQ